jgi:hypothetical protein
MNLLLCVALWKEEEDLRERSEDGGVRKRRVSETQIDSTSVC